MPSERYIEFLLSLGADQSRHSGRTLLDHLVGTHSLLFEWKNQEHVCLGGLFHSIYGTQYYRHQSVDTSMRNYIVDLIGPKAEELAWLFCTVNRMDLIVLDVAENSMLTDKDGLLVMPVANRTFRNLIEIEAANTIEQFRFEAASTKLILRMKLMLVKRKGLLSSQATQEIKRLLKSATG